MRQDIFDPKLQDHYRLEKALEYIKLLELDLGHKVAEIAILTHDISIFRNDANKLNEALRNLPLIKFRDWVY